MAPCHGNGKSKEEWVKFLQKFAFEELNFGRGQNPRPGTWAESEFEKIKRCPLSSGATYNLSGQRDECTCSYHKSLPGTFSFNPQLASSSIANPKSVNSTPSISPEDAKERMPKGWREAIDVLYQKWIVKALFTPNKTLCLNLMLSWFPPEPLHSGHHLAQK